MKKLIVIVLSAMSMMASVRAEVVRASCYDPVGKTNISVNAIKVTESTAVFERYKWYIVKDVVECSGIIVKGTANLILADDAKLTVNGDRGCAGIGVVKGKVLRIWGQEKGTGCLVANGGHFGAGIGSGEREASGMITINGGTVTATGSSGAGIGGGAVGGAGGTVTINDGTVTATGYTGIGGGPGGAGGMITINGGTVTATGDEGAGIGGGSDGAGGMITINGGTVTATGSAGIGGGVASKGKGVRVTINGGTVTATGCSGAGIGGGYRPSQPGRYKVKIDNDSVVVTINGGMVVASSGRYGVGIGGGEGSTGSTVTINGGTVTATGDEGAGIGGGFAGVGGKVTINDGTVTATVNHGSCIGCGVNVKGCGGEVTINGGTIKVHSTDRYRDQSRLIRDPPKNKANAPVYCVTVEDVQEKAVIRGLPKSYGQNSIVPIDGKLYLYLPNGDYKFSVNGVAYAAVVNGKDTAARLDKSNN